MVVAMAVRLLRYDANHPLRNLGHLLLILVGAQVLLGGYVIWSGKQPHLTSLHVMTGAATLALSVILTLSSRTLAWRKARPEAATLIETLELVQMQPVTRPGSVVLGVPADVEAICLKCLSKEPSQRYFTAGQLADDLRRFLDGRPVEALPGGMIVRFGHWCRRNPVAACVIGVLLVYAAIATAMWLRFV